MSSFKDREKAFENKYKHDEDLRFRVHVRRDRMLGFWIAEQIGKEGAEAEEYAKEVVRADMKLPGDDDVVEKVMADLQEAGVDLSEHRLRRKLEELEQEAKQQVMKE
ncbi:MAG: DUF1476 domain-containing protein [Rhodovibrionaceae bacterium]|nr:DUF1476 domain-containing protein [Rhodovibrionaceae bacterium]